MFVALVFFFRMTVLVLTNLVLKNFGHFTTDYVTGKILTKYLLKCE